MPHVPNLPPRARASREAKAAFTRGTTPPRRRLAGLETMVRIAETYFVYPVPLAQPAPRTVEYRPILRDEPITPRWLRANGWFDLHRSDRPGLHRREVAHEVLGGRRPFVSHDDLCIDVMPGISGDRMHWNCWVHQAEPNRHIHVREVRYTWELVRLWEGLTGRTWGEV